MCGCISTRLRRSNRLNNEADEGKCVYWFQTETGGAVSEITACIKV